MVSSKDVAKLILTYGERKGIHDISNLKLQKLLYYVQGYHFAICERELFDEDLRAWEHGPVSVSVWSDYNSNGNQPISCFDEVDESLFDDVSLKVVNYVLDTFGKMGAWALRSQSHAEPPWLNHYDREKDTVDNLTISKQEISNYFVQHISSEQDNKLASILDSLDSEAVATLPDDIDTAEDFIGWVRQY